MISQKICLLSQHNQAPNDLTVEQLVYYGRLPHKKWYEHKSEEDKLFIDWAIEQTGLTRYKDKTDWVIIWWRETTCLYCTSFMSKTNDFITR